MYQGPGQLVGLDVRDSSLTGAIDGEVIDPFLQRYQSEALGETCGRVLSLGFN